MSPAFDAGFDLYKSEPQLTLVEVARRAPNGTHGPKQDFLDFVDGYIAARRQRENHDAETQETLVASGTPARTSPGGMPGPSE